MGGHQFADCFCVNQAGERLFLGLSQNLANNTSPWQDTYGIKRIISPPYEAGHNPLSYRCIVFPAAWFPLDLSHKLTWRDIYITNTTSSDLSSHSYSSPE